MASVDGDEPAADAYKTASQPEDRFAWGFPLFAVGCDIALVVLAYIDRSLLLAGCLFVLVVVVTIVLLVMGIVAILRDRFKRAAALVLTPLIVALPFLFPIMDIQYEARDLIRFYLNKSQYDAVIDKLSPTERASKVVFFKWGVTGFLDAASYYWLVYDESGEIALPDEQRSQAWKDRVYPENRLVVRDCMTSTHHLSGHYYSMVMDCYPG
jgi:hypothetical protein